MIKQITLIGEMGTGENQQYISGGTINKKWYKITLYATVAQRCTTMLNQLYILKYNVVQGL